MDWGSDIAVDSTITTSPVVYVLGSAFTSPTSGGDAVISKFNSNGDITAAARFSGTGGMALAVNQNGVYMTGQRPSPSAYVTAKYDLNLNLITSTALAGDASARAIALDNSGNVYVIGSDGTTNAYNYKIVKYDANLVQQGSPVIYDSGYNDEGSGIAVDNSGNIFVTGMKISGTGYSIVTLKYNSSLVLQNTAEYSTNVYYSTNYGLYPKIALDKNSGSVYIVGTVIGSAGSEDPPFRDILLVKYDSSLNQVGTVVYADGFEGTNLAVDAGGNVYVNGNYYNGVVQDAWLVVKYNSSLVYQSNFTDKSAINSMDEPGGIALDSAGNVYLSGITAPTFIQGDWSNFNLRAKRFPPMASATTGVVTGVITYTGSLGPVSASKPIIVVMNPFPDVFDGFVANGTTYQAVTLTASGTFTFTNVPPGQYHLGVILDVNNDSVTTGDPCELYTPGSNAGSNLHSDPATAFTVTAGHLYSTSPNIGFNDTMWVGQ
ncbi:MAG: SBBP repeat-containing protein [Planctomycetota bacterium]